MKRLLILCAIAAFFLACDVFVPVVPATTPIFYPPTFTPGIRTGTPIVFTPPPTLTITTTGPTPTQTETFTPTTTATATITPTAGPIEIFTLEAVVLACNTSLDISHGMGEVTNAYAVIRNTGTLKADQVCATLSAGDEEREHPDKTKCVISLAPGYQVLLKLTVDTAFQVDTSISVRAQASNGFLIDSAQPSCTDVGMPYFDPVVIGTPQPIQP